MPTDNQELQKGDTVEILLPELAKGTTGTLMRSCSNDCVVVAIDRLPVMQMRINVSRHLVRKVDPRKPQELTIAEMEEAISEKPAQVFVYKDTELGSIREYYSSNDGIPSVTFDPQYDDIVIEDTFPILNPGDLSDFIHLLQVVKGATDDSNESKRRVSSKLADGAIYAVSIVGDD